MLTYIHVSIKEARKKVGRKTLPSFAIIFLVMKGCDFNWVSCSPFLF